MLTKSLMEVIKPVFFKKRVSDFQQKSKLTEYILVALASQILLPGRKNKLQ